MIILMASSVSREREAGTLTLLLSQGTTRWQLLLGKLLALITASSLFLLPLLLACLYVAFSNESALVVILFCLSYVVYFLLWATVVTACSAIFEKSSVSFTVLVVIWMSACVLLPRLGSSVATNIAPSMGKLEADFKVEEKLRSLGDGHDVNDPAFKKLKEDLLAMRVVQLTTYPLISGALLPSTPKVDKPKCLMSLLKPECPKSWNKPK